MRAMTSLGIFLMGHPRADPGVWTDSWCEIDIRLCFRGFGDAAFFLRSVGPAIVGTKIKGRTEVRVSNAPVVLNWASTPCHRALTRQIPTLLHSPVTINQIQRFKSALSNFFLSQIRQ